MSDSTRTARKIPSDSSNNSIRKDECGTDRAASVLRIANRYKSTDRKIKSGCDLFRMGEGGEALYSLVDGWVALYNLLDDGRRQILQFALPGTVLAFLPARGGKMTYGAQALTDAVVSIVPHENLWQLCKDNPEVGMELAGLISHDRSLAYDHLSSIGRRSARERLAYLLLELFIRSRMRWPGHRIEEMHLPLTQEDIGDATGLTGVHVNRMLRDLRREGIVEFHYRRLRILNPDRLVDVAEIDPHVALSWINNEASSEASIQRQIWVADNPAMVPLDARLRGRAQPVSRMLREHELIPERIYAV